MRAAPRVSTASDTATRGLDELAPSPPKLPAVGMGRVLGPTGLGATGGAAATPLAVLFALNLVDELDRIAFGVLSPEIRDTFGLDDSGIVAIGAIAGVTSLLMALPIGVLADRVNRIRLAAVGAVGWGGFTLLTALSPTMWMLALARIGAGVGRIVNEPVHASLLSDYYPASQHPRVFSLHRLANPIGLSSALVVGLLASVLDWRVVFGLLCVPTFLLIPVLLRLREPARGQSVSPMAVVPVQPHLSFLESRRTLFRVRTLRRLWLALPVLGIASVSLPQLVSLFFEREYAYGPTGRGVVTALSGAGLAAGLVLGQRVANRALADGKPELFAAFDGYGIAAIGVALFGLVLSPWAPLSAFFYVLAAVAAGVQQVSYLSLVAMVSPARARAQAYAWAILWLGTGALLSPILANVGEDNGYRLALGILGVTLLAGGATTATARAFVLTDAQLARFDIEAASGDLAHEGNIERPREGSILTCRGLTASYGSTQVLFGVDVDVVDGEILALLGTNGAGKSTLLKAICGSLAVDTGRVVLATRDVTGLPAAQCAAAGIVLAPGGKGVFPGLTVAENMQLASWMNSAGGPEAWDGPLGYFPVLRERWRQKAGNLSGGEQQMLTIAMALVGNPRLLMIDELSLGLAPVVVEELLGVVRQINATGVTVILVEQSVNLALTLADRAIFMEKGQIRFDGATRDLLDRPDILRSVFLEGAGSKAQPAKASGAQKAAEITRAPYAPPSDRRGRPRPPVLEVRALAVSFGGIQAVRDVSFELYQGQILGVIGPNGAGKTTVFDTISGFLPGARGQVLVGGKDVSNLDPAARARRGLGRSFQDARLFPSLTVQAAIAVARERHVVTRDPVAAALASPATRASERLVREEVDRLIELMSLQAFANKFVAELSTGSRRVVDLACMLAHEPSVMLLDEPSSGIAQREAEALGPLLLDIRDELDTAMVVIEHDMPLIQQISDQLLALEFGAVVLLDDPEVVLHDPRVVSGYLGSTPEVIERSGRRRKPPTDRRRRVSPAK